MTARSNPLPWHGSRERLPQWAAMRFRSATRSATARRESVRAMLDAVLGVLPAERLAGHYHDTTGRALDNIEASLARA